MGESVRTVMVSAPVLDLPADPVQGDTPPTDPAALAASWLPGPDEDRMAMTLSTVDGEGFPRSRTVLLSEFDGERLYFHTDAESRKVADLAANPRVSLVFLWPAFTRQLVVQGMAERADDAEIARAYARRSPYLRQLAWQNTEDFAALSRVEREAAWARFRHEHAEPEQPAGWVGFAVRPHRYLFWTSHPDAASRRLEFVRSGAGWSRRHLPG